MGLARRCLGRRRPGPENQEIRAFQLDVMRSFTQTREMLFGNGNDGVEHDLKEMLRAYATFTIEWAYRSNQGAARPARETDSKMLELMQYEKSAKFTQREKIALRYADAIMYDTNQADDARWAALRGEFSEPELIHLGYWTGFTRAIWRQQWRWRNPKS